jgi:CheY-like chemotaxis protein
MVAADGPVLIVEDDGDAREALIIVLEDVGFEVVSTTNGADALMLLRRGIRPCVIALDLMMPVMDGEELLHEIAEDPVLREVPVVITTARGGREPVPAYPNVRTILRKPFPFLRLINEISKACGRED